jgi:hypothetical protein
MVSISADKRQLVSSSNEGTPDNQFTRNRQVVSIFAKEFIKESRSGITPEESVRKIGPHDKTVEVEFECMIRMNEVNESIIK